jgi:hypothetical protein
MFDSFKMYFRNFLFRLPSITKHNVSNIILLGVFLFTMKVKVFLKHSLSECAVTTEIALFYFRTRDKSVNTKKLETKAP